jgi:hypothetical protein
MTDVFKLTHESQIQLLQCSQIKLSSFQGFQSQWSQFSYIIHYYMAYIIPVTWHTVTGKYGFSYLPDGGGQL